MKENYIPNFDRNLNSEAIDFQIILMGFYYLQRLWYHEQLKITDRQFVSLSVFSCYTDASQSASRSS